MIEYSFSIWMVLFFVVAFSFWLESYTKIGQSIGATLLCVIFGMILTNTHCITFKSAVYDTVFSTITYLAIVWLLLTVHFKTIFQVGPRLLLMFFVACGCTVLGAVIAFLFLGSHLPGVGEKLAGVLTGTYTGGSLNFVGVSDALQFPASLFSAAATADNIITAIWIAFSLALPRFLRRWYKVSDSKLDNSSIYVAGDSDSDGMSFSSMVSVFDCCVLVSVGFAVLLVSEWVHGMIPGVPKVIWLSTFSLLLAQVTFFQSIKGAFLFGTIGLHLFFVVIGIGSRFSEIVGSGWIICLFTALVVGIHGVSLLGIGKLMKWPLDSLLVASQAAIGGPSTAMGIAVTKKWYSLSTPGLLIGLVGYAVGNYLGIGVAFLLTKFFS